MREGAVRVVVAVRGVSIWGEKGREGARTVGGDGFLAEAEG